MTTFCKRKYYKTINIDRTIISNFLNKFPELKPYWNIDNVFSVRIMTNLYYGLIHSILSVNNNSLELINIINSLFRNKNNFFSVRKITCKKILKINHNDLLKIIKNKNDFNIILNISNDIFNKKIVLDKMKSMSYKEIADILSSYNITNQSIELFCTFSLFRSDVMCFNVPEFQAGFQIFKNHQNNQKITNNKLLIIYKSYETLFSLFMLMIKNSIK